MINRMANCKDYFEYYQLQTRRLGMPVSSKDLDVPAIAAATHEDILRIVEILRVAKCWRRSNVRDALKPYFLNHSDIAINEAIDLALRLWLMLNVLDDRQSIHLDQSPAIQWGEHCNLQEFISAQFPRTSSLKNQTLDHDFIAVNVVRYSGVEIKWSHSLHDHLSLERRNDRRFLKIYPFKQWLLFQLHEIDKSSQNISDDR